MRMGKRPCSTRVRFSRGTAVLSMVISVRSLAPRWRATSACSDRKIGLQVVCYLCRRAIPGAERRHNWITEHDVAGHWRMREDTDGVSQLMGRGQGQALGHSGGGRIEPGIDENPDRRLELEAPARQIEVGTALTLRSHAREPDHAEPAFERGPRPYHDIGGAG